uniref:Uncharacterized protein n=1 Tax=Heterorhabditis bacteriophora TaxID=37862 RepID=A0A1I7WFX5_HETBA
MEVRTRENVLRSQCIKKTTCVIENTKNPKNKNYFNDSYNLTQYIYSITIILF